MWKLALVSAVLACASHGQQMHLPFEKSGIRQFNSDKRFDPMQALAQVLTMLNPSAAFRPAGIRAQAPLRSSTLAVHAIPSVYTSRRLAPVAMRDAAEKALKKLGGFDDEDEFEESEVEKVQTKGGKRAAIRNFLSRKFDQIFRRKKLEASKRLEEAAAAKEQKMIEREAAMASIRSEQRERETAEIAKKRKIERLELEADKKKKKAAAAKKAKEEELQKAREQVTQITDNSALSEDSRRIALLGMAGQETSLAKKAEKEREKERKITERAQIKAAEERKKRKEEEDADPALYWSRRAELGGK